MDKSWLHILLLLRKLVVLHHIFICSYYNIAGICKARPIGENLCVMCFHLYTKKFKTKNTRGSILSFLYHQFVCLFVVCLLACLLLLNVPVKSYGHVGTVTSDFVGLLPNIEMNDSRGTQIAYFSKNLTLAPERYTADFCIRNALILVDM